MKEIGRKTQALRGLAGSLDIIDSKEFSEPEIKDRRENKEACWRSRLPVKSLGLPEAAVELVVLPCDGTYQLLRFMGQLDGMLHDPNSYGDILRTAHTWGCGTVIMIQMQPTKLSNLAIKLAIMPEVENWQ